MNLLAVDWRELDYEVWGLLALAAVSVIGSLLKKRRDAERTPTAPGEPPGRRPRTAPPARRAPTAGPPRPPRTAPPAARPAPLRPVPIDERRRPTLAPQPPIVMAPPAPRPAEPPRAPAGSLRPAPVARRVEKPVALARKRPTIRPTGVARRARDEAGELGFLEEHEFVHVTDTIGTSAAAAVHRRRAEPAEGLKRILRKRSGVQSAVLLSEILAPPLALRDNSRF
jgi:hypothetical protein